MAIVQISPERSRQSYRHEAFVWHDADEFLAGLVPFVLEGLDAGEPIMVALVPEHNAWLRETLGSRADEVEFADMAELGRNPARIIPAWQSFIEPYIADQRPVRGIGEPIWAGRRREELVECQLHEALLNVAIDPELPFWLICPYDATTLSPDVVEEAERSHPVIVDPSSYHGSVRYGGRAHVETLFALPLPEPVRVPISTPFSGQDVERLFSYLKLEFYVAGLSAKKASDLAAATQRLAQGSLHRGAKGGAIRIWHEAQSLVCEIADSTQIDDVLLGRRAPFDHDHDGLWLANQLCDLVQLRSTSTGTIVRVHTWR